MPLSRIVVVPPTFAEIAELARTLAPSGFELVIVRNEHTELEAALATAEYLVCPTCSRLLRQSETAPMVVSSPFAHATGGFRWLWALRAKW